MTNENKSLGALIKSTREASGKNQETIAEAIGIGRASYTLWEGDVRVIPKKYIPLIAKELALDANLLFALRSNHPVKKIGSLDALPLILTISGMTKLRQLTVSAFLFLAEEQDHLPYPMSPELIAELLKNRHSAK